jgi:hypothetical protein
MYLVHSRIPHEKFIRKFSAQVGWEDILKLIIRKKENIMVKCLPLLISIWVVPVSSLGLETSYPDWGFHGFTQSLQANSVVEQLLPSESF